MSSKLFFRFLTFVYVALVCLACALKTDDSIEAARIKNEENFGTLDGENDANFVVKAVQGMYAEIKLAQLAETKSEDVRLKSIAVKLEQDHSRVLDKLKDFSYKKGIAIPMNEGKDAEGDLLDLQKEDQVVFNKHWISKLIEQHESTIKEYESTWDKTQDQELKTLINNSLPELRSDLGKLNSYKDILR